VCVGLSNSLSVSLSPSQHSFTLNLFMHSRCLESNFSLTTPTFLPMNIQPNFAFHGTFMIIPPPHACQKSCRVFVGKGKLKFRIDTLTLP